MILDQRSTAISEYHSKVSNLWSAKIDILNIIYIYIYILNVR
jgi:hypothetical protein